VRSHLGLTCVSADAISLGSLEYKGPYHCNPSSSTAMSGKGALSIVPVGIESSFKLPSSPGNLSLTRDIGWRDNWCECAKAIRLRQRASGEFLDFAEKPRWGRQRILELCQLRRSLEPHLERPAHELIFPRLLLTFASHSLPFPYVCSSKV